MAWKKGVRYVAHTGLNYKAALRLQECCRQVEAEEVSNSRNKIHQTWELPFSRDLYLMSQDQLSNSLSTEDKKDYCLCDHKC